MKEYTIKNEANMNTYMQYDYSQFIEIEFNLAYDTLLISQNVITEEHLISWVIMYKKDMIETVVYYLLVSEVNSNV